jgi:glycosyltransferase involved in cell wall biosynthesis
MKPKLALFTYSVAVREDRSYKVNAQFGSLIDDLSAFFEKIFYVCAVVDKANKHFWQGKDTEIVGTCLTAYETPLKMALGAFSRIRLYKDIVGRSDMAYIFMPGISGFLATILCMIYGKDYWLYFGSDWSETASFRASWNGLNRLFYPLYLMFIKFAEYVSVKNSSFSLVTGKTILKRLKRYSRRIFEAEPMLHFRKNDMYIRDDVFRGNKAKILFVGAVNERKGVIYLVKALSYLKEFGIDLNTVELLLAGSKDTRYWNQIQNYIESRGIDGCVNYLGYLAEREKLLAAYRESDVFVLPSLGEGFPRVIYEAMSQSLPIIVSKINTIYDTLGDRNLVLYSEPRNPRSVAENIIRLMREHDLRKKLIANGREFVSRRMGGRPAIQVINLLNEFVVAGRSGVAPGSLGDSV